MVKCNYYPEMVSSCSIKIVINFYFTVEILMQIIRIHTSKEFAVCWVYGLGQNLNIYLLVQLTLLPASYLQKYLTKDKSMGMKL